MGPGAIRASSIWRLLALAQLAEILRHGVDITRRDPVGGRAADLPFVPLLDLPAETNLERFQIRQHFAVNSILPRFWS